MKSACFIVCVLAVVALLRMRPANSDEPAESKTPQADLMRGTEAGQVRDDNGLKMKLVWCPPGFVTMENVELIAEPAVENETELNDDDVDPKDEPALQARKAEKITPVKVFLTKGYWLGRYEVTQSEWKMVMRTEPWQGQDFTKEGADFPVTHVSWRDATEFCRNLTEQERQADRLSDGWEYTLPTEAQWERACKARTETAFNFGHDESKLGEYAWFRENSWDAGEQYAHRVGQKRPNPWGLFDMYGNVWEWCRDIYQEKLPGGRDSEVKADERTVGSPRVSRGGCFSNGAARSLSAKRLGYSPGLTFFYGGFRVALSVIQ